jgi:hypothetical protein
VLMRERNNSKCCLWFAVCDGDGRMIYMHEVIDLMSDILNVVVSKTTSSS